ncbi:MAG: hypothetical protein ACRBDL_00310 [Alphaproteobacteria bacterium]
MRLRDQSVHNFLKGYMSASILDSLMEAPTPFEDDEKMVVTGSAITYYLWHKGLSEKYLYKPPSDLDVVLSTPKENERSISNITKFRHMMQDASKDAIENAGFELSASIAGRYDNSLNIKRTFTPDEIKDILFNTRIAEVLKDNQIDNVQIDKEFTTSISMDTMVLDNTVLNTETFPTHPNAEDGMLRYQALSASLAFKVARSTLGRGFEQSQRRPGDVVDIYNIVNAHGYEHDPALLRVMAVVALAQQLPSAFDQREYTGHLLHRNAEELQDALRQHYGTRFSLSNTQMVIDVWEDIVHDVFPAWEDDDPILTQEEDEFIMNFLMPMSGDPKENIIPELLQGTTPLKEVFNQHDELAHKIKNSTFFQQRVTYRQTASMEIEV